MRHSLTATARRVARWSLGGCAALALLLLPATGWAQTIHGEIVERETGHPIPGAVVVLLDAAGGPVAGMVVDSTGRFLLRAPAPGTFRLQAERVGFETATSPPLALSEAAALPYRLALGARPLALEGVTVRGEPRCTVRPREGLAAYAVWQEARKVLSSALWGDRTRRHQFRVRLYERELDYQTLAVERQESHVVYGRSSNPFRSAPLAELLERGFVESSREGYTYYAPDAEVLLSDGFLDTHCFGVTRPDSDTTLIGLTFEPVRDAAIPDVEGVLWVERSTSQLRHLEYGYVGAPQGVADDRTGGRVEFQQLPSGTWITSRWYIRMPLVRAKMTWLNSRSTAPTRSVAIKEDGGEVVSAVLPDGRTIAMGEPGTLRGMVLDSGRAGPLAGARVHLSGTGYVAHSRADGGFELTGVWPGAYVLAVSHPRLDSLGVEPRRLPVSVGEGKESRVEVHVPSPASLARERCPAGAGATVLHGRVLQAGTDWPVPDARVRLVAPRAAGGAPGDSVVERETDAWGRFQFCGVPADGEVTLVAEFGGASSGGARVVVAPGEVVERELRVRAGDAGYSVRLPDGRVLRAERQPTPVRGRVVDAASQAPLGDVRVHLRRLGPDADLQDWERALLSADRLEHRTDGQGRFRTPPLPPGPYEAAFEREGYRAHTVRVVLTGTAAVEVTVSLSAAPD